MWCVCVLPRQLCKKGNKPKHRQMDGDRKVERLANIKNVKIENLSAKISVFYALHFFIVCIVPHFYSISSRLMMRYVCASSLFTFHAIKLFIVFVRLDLKVKKVFHLFCLLLCGFVTIGVLSRRIFLNETVVEILTLDKLMEKKHPAPNVFEARRKIRCSGKFNATPRFFHE